MVLAGIALNASGGVDGGALSGFIAVDPAGGGVANPSLTEEMKFSTTGRSRW
jgi:hypothetical protein